ncbi:hypothetical protein TSAR_004565 [Trichomalopsis sarcophagae]|uniref:Uncharacterized protein n=1 Tax=Trichomalopsis sarcophagae TaxID=543379 RepID=A0A232FDU0_9HYME|nr:hypothetical protein TSAR_004565 [Trichomalopsis sarcophagae]
MYKYLDKDEMMSFSFQKTNMYADVETMLLLLWPPEGLAERIEQTTPDSEYSKINIAKCESAFNLCSSL